MSNIIITGIPRSGTTLTCHLLNKLPDTIALHEPMKIVAKDEFCEDYPFLRDRIADFFDQMRLSLLKDGSAISKQRDGKVPANPRGGYSGISKYLPNFMLGRSYIGFKTTRPTLVKKGRVTFDKALSSNFDLCIKHNGGFVTLLPALTPDFRCYAVIRNPLAVLSSWNSLRINLYDGHMHTVERMNSQLRNDLSQTPDRTERQLHILDWFFSTLERELPQDNIIRYEQITETGGAALQVISPHAAELHEPLNNKNRNTLYNRGTMQFLAKKLLERDGAWWNFYKRSEVEELVMRTIP